MLKGLQRSLINKQKDHLANATNSVRNSLLIGLLIEGVVAQWCNPLTLEPKQSGGVGSRRDRASPLKRHDKGLGTRLALSYFCDPSAWR